MRCQSFLLLPLLLGGCFAAQRPEDSPLHAAARRGDATAVRQLVARGADPNAPWGVRGWTPLEHAIHTNQPAVAAALLDAGADPNRGNALTMAAAYGQTSTVQLLLRRGARPHGALDAALTGANDLDRFTVFDCQTDTVAALAAHERPSPRAKRWAQIKGCREAVALLR